MEHCRFIAEHAKQHISTELEALPMRQFLHNSPANAFGYFNRCGNVASYENTDYYSSCFNDKLLLCTWFLQSKRKVSLNEPVPLRPESWAI